MLTSHEIRQRVNSCGIILNDERVGLLWGNSLLKRKRTCIRFMIYLYNAGTPNEEAKGHIMFYDKGETQIAKKAFDHWDEILSGIRKLLRESGYVKRTDKDGWWFEKQ